MRGLAAAASPDDLWKGMDWWKDMGMSHHEIAVVLGAVGLVAALALLWAVFIRKPKNPESSRYIYPGTQSANSKGPDTQPSAQKRRRKRKHRRRRPTLAETGGLPPLRNDQLPGDPP